MLHGDGYGYGYGYRYGNGDGYLETPEKAPETAGNAKNAPETREFWGRFPFLKDDVYDECSNHGNVKHIHVDKHSAGYVYLRFESVEGASRAQQAMHKRWFARRLISAIFLEPGKHIEEYKLKVVYIARTKGNSEPNTPKQNVDPSSETTHVLTNLREPESEEKPQKSLNEKQQLHNVSIHENQDVLIKCITQDLGFSSGKPVAACLVYKSLLHWRSFEVERTTVFDRIIQTIASAIEVHDSNDVLGYWLCNTSTLLTLLQHTLKASGAAHMTPQRRRSSSASLFGRMSQV